MDDTCSLVWKVLPPDLDCKIGTGGTSDVWQLKDKCGEDVALKLAKDVRHNDSISHEAQILRELSEVPHVLHYKHAVVMWVSGSARLGMVFPLMKHGDLCTLLHMRPCSAREVTKLASCLSSALAKIHLASIAHLDVKPENVLIATNAGAIADIKLIDFGAAVRVDENRCHRTGTPGYVAPEVFKRGLTGTAADVFSLGATLATATTRVPPFLGKTLSETLRATCTKPPKFGKHMSQPFQELLLVMMAKDNWERPSMRQVQTLLEDCSPEPVHAILDAMTGDIRPSLQKLQGMSRGRVSVDVFLSFFPYTLARNALKKVLQASLADFPGPLSWICTLLPAYLQLQATDFAEFRSLRTTRFSSRLAATSQMTGMDVDEEIEKDILSSDFSSTQTLFGSRRRRFFSFRMMRNDVV